MESKIFNALLLMIICFGCSKNKFKMEDNFNIEIKTENNYFNLQKDSYERAYEDSTVKVKLNLSIEEKKMIFSKLNDEGVFDLPKLFQPFGYSNYLPISHIEIFVQNGSIKIISKIGRDKNYFLNQSNVKSLLNVEKIINEICYKRNSIKKLKISDISNE